MTEILELRGFDELEGAFEDLEKGIGPASQAIVAGMGIAVGIVEDAIKARTPVNLGHLRASIQGQVYGRPIDLWGEIGTSLVYGLPVEYGRRPGKQPPVDAIEFWVKRKKIKFSRKGKILSDRQVAWAIAIHIARHGTKGAFMFRDGVEAARPEVERLWEKILEDVVREMARQ